MQVTPPYIPCKCVTFEKKKLSGFLINIDKSKLTSSDQRSFKIKVIYFNSEPSDLWKQRNYEIVMNIDLVSFFASRNTSTYNGSISGDANGKNKDKDKDSKTDKDGNAGGEGGNGNKESGNNKIREKTPEELEKEDDEKDAQEAKTETRIYPKINPFAK
jgi:hypothetical protein